MSFQNIKINTVSVFSDKYIVTYYYHEPGLVFFNYYLQRWLCEKIKNTNTSFTRIIHIILINTILEYYCVTPIKYFSRFHLQTNAVLYDVQYIICIH